MGGSDVRLVRDTTPATDIPGIFETGLKRNTAVGGISEATYVFDGASGHLEGQYFCVVGRNPDDEQFSFSFYVRVE